MNNQIFSKWWFWALVIIGIVILSRFTDRRDPPMSPYKMVFDVPALISKDLNGLRETLGTPSYDKEPTRLQAEEFNTWEKTWDKEGYSLMVTYNIGTRSIVEYSLLSDSDEGYIAFRDTNNILKIGNLKSNSSEYSVKFIKARNASGYTGANIIRKN